MSYAIGIASLLFWCVSLVGASRCLAVDDKHEMHIAEWHSIAYLAIAAWCFH
jgi:hypothetical protein